MNDEWLGGGRCRRHGPVRSFINDRSIGYNGHYDTTERTSAEDGVNDDVARFLDGKKLVTSVMVAMSTRHAVAAQVVI